MTGRCFELKDKYNNAMVFGNIGDILIPPFPLIQDFRRHAQDIRNMELNPNDVIIVGYPKTGSHWTYEIVHMLMKGNSEHCSRKQEANSHLEMTPITPDHIAPADKPRLFYTHLRFHHLPKQVREKNVKVVQLERNPKDVWVSMYNHASIYNGPMSYQGTWCQFFDLMMSFGFWYGNWFDYALDWEAAVEKETAAGLPIFVNHFEDLKKDPVSQIEKLDEFLGYKRGRELCEQIAEACQFTTMKAVKERQMEEEMKRIFKPNTAGFYRKGEVGDWKNWFTVAQNEEFDQVFKDRMQGSKLRYSFM